MTLNERSYNILKKEDLGEFFRAMGQNEGGGVMTLCPKRKECVVGRECQKCDLLAEDFEGIRKVVLGKRCSLPRIPEIMEGKYKNNLLVWNPRIPSVGVISMEKGQGALLALTLFNQHANEMGDYANVACGWKTSPYRLLGFFTTASVGEVFGGNGEISWMFGRKKGRLRYVGESIFTRRENN